MVNQEAMLATVNSQGPLLLAKVVMKISHSIMMKVLMAMGSRCMGTMPAPRERVTMLAPSVMVASIATRMSES